MPAWWFDQQHGGGWLGASGSHAIDQIRWWLGDFAKVSADVSLLPNRQAVGFSRSATYGPFIILLLIFLLPFLGQISNLGGFFLFRISYYILLGSLKLASLVSGLDFSLLTGIYSF